MMDVSYGIPGFVGSSSYQMAYGVNNKLDRFVHCHKDRLGATERASVVYGIDCLNCDASCVGRTRRRLNARVRECRSHVWRITAHPSPITDCRLQFNHEFDWDRVVVLNVDSNCHGRFISEITHGIGNRINGLSFQSDIGVLDSICFPLLDLVRDGRFWYRPIFAQFAVSSSCVADVYLDGVNCMTLCLIN